MGISELAESIVLQSIEDLWDAKFRKDGLDFLTGEGLSTCAALAGMKLYDQIILINMTEKIIRQTAYAVPEKFSDRERQKHLLHRSGNGKKGRGYTDAEEETGERRNANRKKKNNGGGRLAAYQGACYPHT